MSVDNSSDAISQHDWDLQELRKKEKFAIDGLDYEVQPHPHAEDLEKLSAQTEKAEAKAEADAEKAEKAAAKEEAKAEAEAEKK